MYLEGLGLQQNYFIPCVASICVNDDFRCTVVLQKKGQWVVYLTLGSHDRWGGGGGQHQHCAVQSSQSRCGLSTLYCHCAAV